MSERVLLDVTGTCGEEPYHVSIQSRQPLEEMYRCGTDVFWLSYTQQGLTKVRDLWQLGQHGAWHVAERAKCARRREEHLAWPLARRELRRTRGLWQAIRGPSVSLEDVQQRREDGAHRISGELAPESGGELADETTRACGERELARAAQDEERLPQVVEFGQQQPRPRCQQREREADRLKEYMGTGRRPAEKEVLDLAHHTQS